MAKKDPQRGFRFRLEIDDIQIGSCQSVSGLERECQIEAYREGGVNHYEHQFVTLTKYPPLVLKRGWIDYELWTWHKKVIDGEVEPKNITLILIDDKGQDTWRWVFENAYPSKWSGSELDAMNNSIATESIDFVHEGMKRV